MIGDKVDDNGVSHFKGRGTNDNKRNSTDENSNSKSIKGLFKCFIDRTQNNWSSSGQNNETINDIVKDFRSRIENIVKMDKFKKLPNGLQTKIADKISNTVINL